MGEQVWEINKVPFIKIQPRAVQALLAKGEIPLDSSPEEFTLAMDQEGLLLIFRNTRFLIPLGMLTELWLHSIVRNPECPQKQAVLVPPSSTLVLPG